MDGIAECSPSPLHLTMELDSIFEMCVLNVIKYIDSVQKNIYIMISTIVADLS
jgi:hypothetical protein